MPSKQQVIPQNEGDVKPRTCNTCDATFGNLPFVPLFAMILSVVGSGLLWSGAMGAKPTLDDYHVSWDDAFLGISLGIVFLLLLHGAVLCHGFAVSTLETSRELWHTKDVGCYCGACADPSTTCGQRCRTQQKTCRKACQATWAVLGTTLLIGSYGGLLAAGTVSTTATASSYVFLKSCHTYSTFVDTQFDRAQQYLEQGRSYLGKADNVTQQFLLQYESLMHLQEVYQATAMAQLPEQPKPPIEKELSNKRSPYFREEKRYFQQYRRLTTFHPATAMAQGQGTLDVLNRTLAETERNVQYLKAQVQTTVAFCEIYGGLYKHVQRMAAGTYCFLTSHLLAFGAHYRQFTAWNYEARLVELGDYR